MFFQDVEETKIYSFWGDMTNEEEDDMDYGSGEEEDLDLSEESVAEELPEEESGSEGGAEDEDI
jgi:hypothetical protein